VSPRRPSFIAVQRDSRVRRTAAIAFASKHEPPYPPPVVLRLVPDGGHDALRISPSDLLSLPEFTMTT